MENKTSFEDGVAATHLQDALDAIDDTDRYWPGSRGSAASVTGERKYWRPLRFRTYIGAGQREMSTPASTMSADRRSIDISANTKLQPRSGQRHKCATATDNIGFVDIPPAAIAQQPGVLPLSAIKSTIGGVGLGSDGTRPNQSLVAFNPEVRGSQLPRSKRTAAAVQLRSASRHRRQTGYALSQQPCNVGISDDRFDGGALRRSLDNETQNRSGCAPVFWRGAPR